MFAKHGRSRPTPQAAADLPDCITSVVAFENVQLQLCWATTVPSLSEVLIGLLYIAYPDGCRHNVFVPAEAKVLPSALVLATICALL